MVRDEGSVAGTALTGVRPPVVNEHRARGVRRRVLPALVLAVAVAVSVVALVSSRSDGQRFTAYHGPLPHFSVPSGYHITYAITGGSSEDLFVRRPFESYDARTTHKRPALTMAFRLGEQVTRSRSGPASLVHTAMSPALRDVRLDAVARDAIRTNRLRLIGRASVLKTTCYVFRSAAPLNSGPLERIGRRSYVDSCVDRRGLVLYERTVTKGKVTSERRATRARVGDAASEANYQMAGDPFPPERGGGGVHEVTVDSRPPSGPFWDVPSAPSGFRHAGRYALVPSQPQAYSNMTPSSMNAFGLPNSLVASIDDAYTRGPDAIVIEQGSTVNDAKFAPAAGGEDVDLGPVLGHGQLLFSASASEVVAEPHEGRRFVRVIGTVPPLELIAIARSMTLQPPGTMERLT